VQGEQACAPAAIRVSIRAKRGLDRREIAEAAGEVAAQ
jgi:hypothetical protein